MLSQSHSVNTSIESCVTHFLGWKESQSQPEKNALCKRALNACLRPFVSGRLMGRMGSTTLTGVKVHGMIYRDIARTVIGGQVTIRLKAWNVYDTGYRTDETLQGGGHRM